MLKHLQSYVTSPINSLKDKSTLFNSLLSTEVLAGAAFAASGAGLQHARFYAKLDRELDRLQRFEFPKIMHLLRRQVEAIKGHISADQELEVPKGRSKTVRRIPADRFVPDDIVIPDLQRQGQYRDLCDQFYQRKNDDDPITTFKGDYKMERFRTERYSLRDNPNVQM